jgi:hypothetical protein
MPIAIKHHHPIQVSSLSLYGVYACLLLFNFMVIINLVAID